MARGQIAVVFGTRPELIKLSGVVRGLGSRAYTVHTGQHYDPAMSSSFLDELGLGAPDAQLDVGGRSRGQQIGVATDRLDALFADLAPVAVVVQGDTNAAVAGALAANARQVPLVHVEAGLRSFDRLMPEEHNRVLVDHLADLCLAPTTVSRDHLLAERVPIGRIVVTGNTVVDAVDALLPDAATQARVLEHAGVDADQFVLATLHRPENVDDPDRLALLLDGLAALDRPTLFPVHPRTAARIREFGLGDRLAALHETGPLGYSTFLALLARCALAVSDSGGVVEEASVVKRPVLVVRRSTERPEVLGTFATLTDAEELVARAAPLLDDIAAEHRRLAGTPSPYGDGDASGRSVAAIDRCLGT